LGRLTYQKGFERLVRAFARVSPAYPGWDLAIFGHGEDRESLQALAVGLGLEDRIRFPGQVNNPYAVLKAAGIFALSPRFEGFPFALCEAMASGLPVVSMDCPSGPGEMIVDGVNGLLVPDGDVEALAGAMGRLMGDEALRASLGARAVAMTELFALDIVMEKWEALLRGKACA
jgi:GalNAc-alpha-(1->4)-GalNAc-alpha-(1->3)-diNAcBac-PP-undecaprenol alpha-1,4-N-acetyl-D-galactosaminyltransferase